MFGELQSALIGGKINKVYEPSNNEVILGIYSQGKNYALLCNISSNNYRFHLTTTSKPNPLNAPNFCMLLRKHLIGCRIKAISMSSLERIVTMELEGYNELNDLLPKTLVIELMGKHSNMILLNENGKIIDSLRHLDVLSGSLRDILPAHDYVLPSSEKSDFTTTSKEEFLKILDKSTNINENSNKNIAKSISNTFTGISYTFVSSLLSSMNISEESMVLYDTMQKLLSNLGSKNVTCVSVAENDYSLLPISHKEDLQTNFFLDDFYSKKEKQEAVITYRNELLKLVLTAVKKISKKLSNINSKLKECENMEQYRIYGELITSHLYEIDANRNLENITLQNYYDENKEIVIPLDSSISVSYNAKKFFKKYHKLKNTLEIVTEQKLETEKELDYLESIVYELENASSVSELDEIYQEICENGIFKVNAKANVKKNKVNKRKFHDEYEPIVYTIDGFLFYVGKNNKQNDYITTKLGKNEDLWFHTQEIRGSHCLLKCNGQKVKDSTILACAQIAAFHSKGKLSSNVPVDYCFSKYVKKPSNSKPGMVIYTNQKTLYVEPTIPVFGDGGKKQVTF